MFMDDTLASFVHMLDSVLNNCFALLNLTLINCLRKMACTVNFF